MCCACWSRTRKWPGYQFVTWVWDFDRRGVSHGHYFEGNYHAAKEDFAVRSGLISRAQLFSADQLAELYRATDFFLEEGPEPEDKQMKALQEARTKSNIPSRIFKNDWNYPRNQK